MSDSSERPEILHTSFNAAGTHCCTVTERGIHVFGLTPEVSCVENRRITSVSAACLLLNSNLVAYVKSERSCVFFDFKKSESSEEVLENAVILDIRVTSSYLLVVMANSIRIYTWPERKEVLSIDTATNPHGTCAVASTSQHDFIAFPAKHESGGGYVGLLRLPKSLVHVNDHHGAESPGEFAGPQDSSSFSLVVPTPQSVLEHLVLFEAHQGAVKSMAFSPDGRRLATMSLTGTLIRLFDTAIGEPSVKLMKEARRGHSSTEVFSIAFSPSGEEVACYASSGTLHVFSALPCESPSRFFDERALAKFTLSGHQGTIHFLPGKKRCICCVLKTGWCHLVDFFPGDASPSGAPGDPVSTEIDLIQVLRDAPTTTQRRVPVHSSDRIPLVLDPPEHFGTPKFTKAKFLVQRVVRVSVISHQLLRKLNLSPETNRLQLSFGAVDLDGDMTMGEVGDRHLASDELLHLQYRVEAVRLD